MQTVVSHGNPSWAVTHLGGGVKRSTGLLRAGLERPIRGYFQGMEPERAIGLGILVLVFIVLVVIALRLL